MEKSWEGKIYVGSREQYDGPEFPLERVKGAVKEYQQVSPVNACVRYSECGYLHKEYDEKGWELAVIQYPRFKKEESELETFCLGLANHLLKFLNQNRVSVVLPEHTWTFESANAVEAPKAA